MIHKSSEHGNGAADQESPQKMYLGDIYTISVNLAGLPALTVPYGLSENGLPIGVQFIGGWFQEKHILKAGYAMEQSRGYQMPAFARDAILGREEK